jgi:DNA sulfur modification protein DndB
MKSGEKVFPSLRGRMGDWWYYVTTLTLADVSARIRRADEIHEKAALKTWIQRTISPERLQQIARYLRCQEQHFFNGIVVGIYGGEPEWFSIEIGESLVVKDINIDERTQTSVGLLKLTGREEIFAIDGQHRVEGIKEALKKMPELGDEEQCVIFVGHKKTDEGRERTRRLFSTLNKYAVPVSPGELVALSEDDAFAIVTRQLIDTYQPLNEHFVPLTSTTNIPKPNNICITTVLGLYTLISIISYPKTSEGNQLRNQAKIGPPTDKRIQGIYELQLRFWEALREYVPEIREVTDSQPNNKLASKYRDDNGGHVLFRPFGQKAFANAIRLMMDKGMELMARQEIPPKSKKEAYNLEDYYRKAIDNPNAKINDIPQIAQQ